MRARRRRGDRPTARSRSPPPAHGEAVRVLASGWLLDLFEAEAGVEERLQEEGERDVDRADADADARLPPDARSLAVARDLAVPARMQLGVAALRVVGRVRPDPARMRA